VAKAIENQRAAIIQGPPGTGKTTVYKEVIKKALKGALKLNDDEVLCYEVPHNAGVKEMLRDVVSIMKELGYDKREIPKMTRVYGSQFDFTGYEKLNSLVDQNVKIIITTEFQRIRSRNGHDKYHLLIDEASKSRLHEAFIVHAYQLAKAIEEDEELEGSISVIGDPMQAIVLPESYSMWPHLRHKRLILEGFLRGLLMHEGVISRDQRLDPLELTNLAYQHLKGKWFEFLDVTYRLPSPTEKPISEGFYHGRLKAFQSARDRLKDITLEPISKVPDMDEVKEAAKIIEEAVTTERSIILVETAGGGYEEYQEKHGILYDPVRAKWGIAFGLALSYMTLKETYVLSPYTEQSFYMKLECQRAWPRYSKEVLLDFTTVQKFLGLEAFNIVAVLGKEWYGKRRDKEDAYSTIYFKEPELFNVQLSRHLGVLVIVGKLRKLYKQAKKADQRYQTKKYKPIWVTIAQLFEMAGMDVEKSSKLPAGYKSEGEGAIFIKLG